MRKDKEKAIELRIKGFSYNEISSRLGISKSTLNYWLSKIKLSERAKSRLEKRVYAGSIKGLIKRNKNQTVLAEKRAREIRKKAGAEVKKLIHSRLFLVGISLYWAEGYKKGAHGSKWKAVDFANSDSELVKIMLKFFRTICKVENSKIKIQLIAHRNVDINKTIEHWSKISKIPRSQFIKTYCSKSPSNKRRKHSNSLTYGTVHIRINDVKLFFRIIGWIDGLKLNI